MRHAPESVLVAMIRLLWLGLTRQMRIVLGLIVAGIVLSSFAVGFLVGSVGASSLGGECDLIRQESQRLMAEARALDPETSQHRLKARTSLYHVINNRGCFSAQDLATAQAALDELNAPRPAQTP